MAADALAIVVFGAVFGLSELAALGGGAVEIGTIEAGDVALKESADVAPAAARLVSEAIAGDAPAVPSQQMRVWGWRLRCSPTGGVVSSSATMSLLTSVGSISAPGAAGATTVTGYVSGAALAKVASTAAAEQLAGLAIVGVVALGVVPAAASATTPVDAPIKVGAVRTCLSRPIDLALAQTRQDRAQR